MGKLIDVNLIYNGSTDSSWIDWPGGVGTFSVTATWGGATIALQLQSADGTTGIDVGTETTLTANGAGNFELGPCKIRADVTGSPSAVYARVSGIAY